jgi:hypothetical protein
MALFAPLGAAIGSATATASEKEVGMMGPRWRADDGELCAGAEKAEWSGAAAYAASAWSGNGGTASGAL